MDGADVLKNARSQGEQLPILILTARDTLEDRVNGLDFGADDYMTKPFELPEFEARVRALIRRGQLRQDNKTLELGAICLDVVGQRVFADGKPIPLTANEINLLEIFLRNTGRVLSKEQLIEYLYGWEDDGTPNALEVAIHRLRKKLGAYGFQLKTVRGLGYLIEGEP
jgi:two-component system OmpR family response regulator